MSSHVKPSVGPCDTCGKQRYETKSDAKAAARRMKSRSGRLHPYKCGPTYWHIGHLPARVIAGDKTRAEIPTRRTR